LTSPDPTRASQQQHANGLRQQKQLHFWPREETQTYEDFILCRAFVKASEDSVKGSNQKSHELWETTLRHFQYYSTKFISKHSNSNAAQFFKSRTAKMLENRKGELLKVSNRKKHQLFEFHPDCIPLDIPEYFHTNQRFLGDATKMSDRPQGNKKAKAELKLSKVIATKTKELAATPISSLETSVAGSGGGASKQPSVSETVLQQMSGTMSIISTAILDQSKRRDQMEFITKMVAAGKSMEEIERLLTAMGMPLKPPAVEGPTIPVAETPQRVTEVDTTVVNPITGVSRAVEKGLAMTTQEQMTTPVAKDASVPKEVTAKSDGASASSSASALFSSDSEDDTEKLLGERVKKTIEASKGKRKRDTHSDSESSVSGEFQEREKELHEIQPRIKDVCYSSGSGTDDEAHGEKLICAPACASSRVFKRS